MPACIGEGNGNPLQYSSLENPRDGGAWRPATYGVTESDTTEGTWQQHHSHFSCSSISFIMSSHTLLGPLDCHPVPNFFFPCQTFFLMSVRVISTRNRSDKTTLQIKSGHSFLLPEGKVPDPPSLCCTC